MEQELLQALNPYVWFSNFGLLLFGLLLITPLYNHILQQARPIKLNCLLNLCVSHTLPQTYSSPEFARKTPFTKTHILSQTFNTLKERIR